jgi:hypothetical protein
MRDLSAEADECASRGRARGNRHATRSRSVHVVTIVQGEIGKNRRRAASIADARDGVDEVIEGCAPIRVGLFRSLGHERWPQTLALSWESIDANW